MPPTIAFLDLETTREGKIVDIGCLKSNGDRYQGHSAIELEQFLNGVDIVCGHNILLHDLKVLQKHGVLRRFSENNVVDTLFLSPLLFPAKPYHRLVKDDKLDPENRNNPINDAIKARDLLDDELWAFDILPLLQKQIFFGLLHKQPGFSAFFQFTNPFQEASDITLLIRTAFKNLICEQSPIEKLTTDPVAFSYSLALISANDKTSILPPWVVKNYPEVNNIFKKLRSEPCLSDCSYCSDKLDTKKALKRYFDYDHFRSFGDEPLQEKAVNAAIRNKSLLVVFPTGGGKSVTFQIPALISGETEKGLTVVISPLQSLMKDQVDNLEKKGITDAVTINGSLDPVERGVAIERVANGQASILYLSPEMLRSNTIERLLQGRKISRFVIDEAHCFSAWGQDFRVDYLYIGDFIKRLQTAKRLTESIPVSCFTATAKLKVIEDIRSYFKDKLDIELELFTTTSARTNLTYKVINHQDEEEKYNTLRNLLSEEDTPSIVYVSRTRKSEQIAERLRKDGVNARHYHGQMDRKERLQNQDAFMHGHTDVMVATTAFGMGVDKDNVTKVIHYDISDSLENYIQEAGRAGRNEKIQASCYVLYNEEDLNKHFILLNQTRITLKEINQVWSAIKGLSKFKPTIHNSALEIARRAGWDDEVKGMESRITTAIAALEESGYLKRLNNSPRVFATSITVRTAQEAINRIDNSGLMDVKEKENATRIIKKLFATKRSSEIRDEEAESRVDHIADHLGLQKADVIRSINHLRQASILKDDKDLSAFIKNQRGAEQGSRDVASRFVSLEYFFLKQLKDQVTDFHIRELNEAASATLNETFSTAVLKTVMNIWMVQGWIRRERGEYEYDHYRVERLLPYEELEKKLDSRRDYVGTIINYLFTKSQLTELKTEPESSVEFSVIELLNHFKQRNELYARSVTPKDIEDTLYYLSKIEAIKIEGGFMVLYNRLTIEKKELNPLVKYKQDDFKKLEEFYNTRVQQIHIVGEYAKKMVDSYTGALEFVSDYFQLNYSSFLNKYFPGRKEDLGRRMTPKRFASLFGELSLEQLNIIRDEASQYIVVAAGPGSGKTRVLVHKLAALLQLDDVKHEQLLMLTFSRAAVVEFKQRLKKLIGNAAYFVDIRTFHSYCFELLGKLGTLEKSDEVIIEAVEAIKTSNIPLNRITKTVLVIDEAQDINPREFELIKTLVEKNEEMKVIIVGDDDQNIFEWRGASPECILWFLEEKSGKQFSLLDNYRSNEEILSLSNKFIEQLPNRIKTEPVLSKRGKGGRVEIIKYVVPDVIVPLVNHLKIAELKGSTAVLTRTNEEASLVAGLLRKEGISARLIQSNDGFPISNLLELRFFSDTLNTISEGAKKISEDDFTVSVQNLKEQFQSSSKYELAVSVIDAFRSVSNGHYHLTDWKQHLAESKLENFLSVDQETILVSTIHKAKGREFDNVFLLLNGRGPEKDEDVRLFYVAMTRAKNLLLVHYNQSYLIPFFGKEHYHTVDDHLYSTPDTITINLTLKNVYLDYFKNDYRQSIIDSLIPGSTLQLNGDSTGCQFNGKHILYFSGPFKEELKRKQGAGYIPKLAKVDFVVYYKGRDWDREVKVVLPVLELGK